jgi:aspartyl-tRNA(Asn)/glutamyl-tRNA(Gln) amidotransferase subunit C
MVNMALTIKEVEHIAQLARLDLTEEEKQRYCHQLSSILEYAARLQEVDTSGIPPTSSVLPPHIVLRADEVEAGLKVEDVLRNAPRREKDQFRVPPVLE